MQVFNRSKLATRVPYEVPFALIFLVTFHPALSPKSLSHLSESVPPFLLL